MILSAILHAAFHEMLNIDSFELVLNNAEETCKELGVSEESWKRVSGNVMKNYMRERRRNPLSLMF